MSASRSFVGALVLAGASTLAAPARAEPGATPAAAPAPKPAPAAAPAPSSAPAAATASAAAPPPAAPPAAAPAATPPAAPGPEPTPAPAFIPPPSAAPAAEPAPAAADKPDHEGAACSCLPSAHNPPSLEAFGMLAGTIATGEPAYPESTDSFRRVGVYGELGLAYRSRYFVDPYIAFGYATLASADTHLPDGPWGAGGTLHQHLGYWTLSPGLTADLWRFRPRLGIGLAGVLESNSYNGDKNSVTQLAFAFQAGLGFNFYDTGRFRLDADFKFSQAKGADVSFYALGLTARGDLVYFGGGS